MFGSIFSLNSISFALVFIEEGYLLFSPCVVPLIPIYMSYLAGNTERVHPDGSVSFDGKRSSSIPSSSYWVFQRYSFYLECPLLL